MSAAFSQSDANPLPIGKAAGSVALVQDCLTSLREGKSVFGELRSLQSLDIHLFREEVSEDGSKKAFWVNAYNVFNLVGMRQKPVVTLAERKAHFFARRHLVAGMALSLNDIEHGILRRSKLWWAKGWLRNPFPGRRMRDLQLSQDDPRIHFALNCGANGCPAIRFYTVEGVEAELETATRGFFATDIHRDDAVIWMSAIFRMYLGDFGGRKGLEIWLKRYRPDLLAGTFRIRFLPYDLSPNLDKFED